MDEPITDTYTVQITVSDGPLDDMVLSAAIYRGLEDVQVCPQAVAVERI